MMIDLPRSQSVIMNEQHQVFTIGAAIEAVQHGRVEELSRALEHGISPNAADADKCSLLHWAAINNRYDCAKLLLDKGAELNNPGGTLSETPLQWASRNEGYGFTHMIALFLEKGATLANKSVLGHDALFLAVQAANTNIAFLLLAIGGADANTIDATGTTPLLWMYKKRRFMSHSDMELIRLLLSFGADPTLADAAGATNASSAGEPFSYGNNCLHYVASAPIEYLDYALLQTVVEKGGNALLEAVNSDGKTPLEVAKSNRNGIIIAFYKDWRIYKTLPDCSVTWFTGALVLAYYILLVLSPSRYLTTVLGVGLMAVFMQWGMQSSIGKRRSRLPHGFAWGVIVTTWVGIMRYIGQDGGPFEGGNMSSASITALYVFLTTLELSVVYTLYATSTTKIRTLGKRAASEVKETLQRSLEYSPLTKEASDSNCSSSSSSSDMIRLGLGASAAAAGEGKDFPECVRTLVRYGSLNGHESERQVDKAALQEAVRTNKPLCPRARLCATCLQDKALQPLLKNSIGHLSKAFEGGDKIDVAHIDGPDTPIVNATHCGQCDSCCVNLDHHCPFVDTCVGMGNRRIFLAFCASASTGCLTAATLMFHKVYYNNPLCADELRALKTAGMEGFGRWAMSSFNVFYRMFHVLPEVPAVILLAFFVGLWIACLFWQQLYLIATCTSTAESLAADKELWRGSGGGATLLTADGSNAYYETSRAGSAQGWANMAKELWNFCLSGQYRVVARAQLRLADEKRARDIRLNWVDRCMDTLCLRLTEMENAVSRGWRGFMRRVGIKWPTLGGSCSHDHSSGASKKGDEDLLHLDHSHKHSHGHV